MNLPKAEITDIEQQFTEASRELSEACEDFGESQFNEDDNPAIAIEAMTRLFDVLSRIEADSICVSSAAQPGAAPVQTDSDSNDEITELGDFGITLLMQITEFCAQLKIQHCHQTMEQLFYPMALWIARHDGELNDLEPVVNCLAKIANQIKDPAVLSQLCIEMGEILEATSIRIQQDLKNLDPGRPWRVLNINRAIVATRSHNPPLMERVFALFVQNLPEEAPAFFSEGMEQMAALNYPMPVREVMAKYHKEWPVKRQLH